MSDSASTQSSESSSRVSKRRRILIAVAALFFAFVMYQVLNPFPDQPYMEISHGDHIHYVPKDRNQDVPLNRFPTQPPGPNERILPDGRVVTTPPSQ
jgi:hypothetical protein